MMRLNIWCKNKFYLVKVLKGFNCLWWFIRVVIHAGSGCQSNIKADCLDLFSQPAPAITRIEILYNNNNNNNNNNISLFYEDDILSINLSNIWSST